MILALGLILSLQAVTQARHAAAMAWEVRRAHTLLTHLMESAPRSFDEQQGDSDGFSWRVEVQLTGAERPVEVCRRSTTLTNIRSGRNYSAATLEACPPADPA
ncbi:hypothetical protein [Bosea sp. (in: a-proteobacteria)]|uniref:hypothetical protein n=1 Tax=Bosea sp. (in: a-proteobacteria) TaxID=1871050 RepID=UPI001214F4A9|nr:hypothetical protein [Bosea sp. (in: a-proteobacteria)]TAJ28467.1 MAG: hypothetical protein EPO59_18450 [Bosea sp. (in: a-proteobacteria)]